MLIVRTLGGLGNQMYGYGMYKKLLSLGRKAKMDISFYRAPGAPSFELGTVFNISADYANTIDVMKAKGIVARIVRRVGIPSASKRWVIVDPHDQYDPSVLELDNVYLDGYWSSFDYFAGIEDDLRREYTFKQPLVDRNVSVARQIADTNSVSIHVRRGDYLKYPDIYEMLTADYYRRAIKRISETVSNPKFFCFSNDIEWCKSSFYSEEIEYIDWNTSAGYIDMQLMSMCKHNIVANSTFSIWAAWLNNNADKVVLRPERYFCDASYKTDRLWPKEWTSIEN